MLRNAWCRGAHMRSIGIAGVFFALTANVAAALSIPDCETLASWLATEGDPVPYNSAGSLPPPYGTDATATVFGTTLLEWSDVEIRALDSALSGCRSEANRAKDAALTTTFSDARRELSDVGKRLRDRTAALEAVEKALASIDAAAPTPALRDSLVNLAAAPDGGLARTQSSAAEARPIARFGDKLTEAEGLALRAALADRAEAVARLLIDGAVAALSATPETLDGILALRQSAIDAHARMGDAAAEVIAAAAAREAEIVTALAATDPAPVSLPTCAALVAWGADLRPQETRRTRAGIVLTGLEAPELAALFGKPFEGWDATDLDVMGKLAAQCREAGRAGMLGGEPQAMMRAGQNVVILHAQSANQPAIFAALGASLAAAEEIIAAVAATVEGIDGLDALPGLRQRAESLEELDAARAIDAIDARRAALSAAEITRIEGELVAAPGGLDGFFAVLEAGAVPPWSPLGRHLSDPERAALRTAAIAAAERIGSSALQELEAELAALPETQEGLAEARAIAANLAGDLPVLTPLRAAAEGRAEVIETVIIMAELPDFEAELAALPPTVESLEYTLSVGILADEDAENTPAYAAYSRAAADRAATLRDALAQERCAPALAGLSASDATRPVLMGTKIISLGRMLCAMDADSPPRYAAPGFFGSQHTVEATVRGGYAIKLILTEGDTPVGGKALIGKRIEDGEGARDVSVAEWQVWTDGVSAGPGACASSWGVDDLTLCLIANPDAPIPFGR
jgi:hypothetical protein